MIPTKTISELRTLEALLRRDGFRGHVYLLPGGTTIMFATSTSAAHGIVRNLGPRPILNRVEDVRGTRDAEEWFNTLRSTGEEVPIPQTIWNTRHLVITGVMPRHALAMIFEHPHMYQSERVGELAKETGVEQLSELRRIFTKATGNELTVEAEHYFTRMMTPAPGPMKDQPE